MGILGSEIGQYKISKKKLCMPMTGFIKRYNELIPLCVQGFETIEINDEYDTEEITGHIQKGGVVCKGAGGTGKSYGASKVNLNKLWITPNNLLAQEIHGEAITLHNLLGLLVESETGKTPYDVSGFEMIIFDEIYFYNTATLSKIKAFMNAHPNIIFTATGDCNQLEPIEINTNHITNYKPYIEACVSQIFNKQIVLKIVKRCRTKADGERLNAFKNDILNEDMDVMAVIKKHGINLIENGYDNVKTLKNIAFYNKTGKALSEHLHYRTHEEQYEIGVKLVCRKSGFKQEQNDYKQ